MWLRGHFGTATRWSCLFVAAILITSTSAKKDAPTITSVKFENLPQNVEYFDDSDVVLLQDWVENVIYRTDDAGETWSVVKGIPANEAWSMYMHPFDKKRAYVLTQENTHWKTQDRGETWEKFFTDAPPSAWRQQPLSFHASDPDKIIFNGQDCMGIFCDELSMYTTDGFSTSAKLLRADTSGCYWAKSTELFTTGDKDLDTTRILCVVRGKYSAWTEDYRLLISDDYFEAKGNSDGEFEPDLEPGRAIKGVANMAVVKKFLVAATSSKNTDEMALYVTDDTIKWHRAMFPHDHKLEEDAYTILESTNYSIQLDVFTNSRARNPMGVLFSSNSNGTYFTRNIEHTNRIPEGYVDFEKMSGVQGIVLVNVVDNWEAVQKTTSTAKKVVSLISFDDGRMWHDLKVGKDTLHLHSVTEMSNIGRVLSSPAPGLAMGVGNTGEFLKPYSNGHTYVSDDAGLTWKKALDGPHKYEFGDQGSIIVAIPEGETSTMVYSLDHGENWETIELPVEKFRAHILTTTQDSTSLKFLLVGYKRVDDETAEHMTMSIDFDGLHERTCKDSDLEKWYARVDENGDPSCLMGHKQYYNRRKKNADCFLKQEFKDPEVQTDPCECTDMDFECDFNFVKTEDRKDCKQSGNLIVPDDQCKAFDDETTFMASSGWRLIPGNDCKRVSSKQKDDPVERKCSEAVGTPASGSPEHKQQPFTGNTFLDKIYLERTDSSFGDDETIIARTDKGRIYLSKDHGKSWEEILKNAGVQLIIPHPYFNDVVYFITAKKEVFYSVDRGNNILEFGSKAPSYASENYWPMNFHPKHKDWIIWVGVKDKECVRKTDSSPDCHAEASLSEDRGDHWKTLQRYVRKCEFVPAVPGRRAEDKLIYCDVKTEESPSNDNNPWQLVSSTNFFEDQETHFDDIINFAMMSEFIVVATKDADTNMKAEASVDGATFSEALFPSNFKVPHQSGYTALDSSTHSVFLLVTVEPSRDYKYGSLIKSNSNGTSYVLSLSAINQDADGYVDFEKALSIEGVALANIVANAETVKDDQVKRLKTRITHNDGADWAFLPPPSTDIDGSTFECSSASDKCSLHIHGYTERAYKSHTYSSPSAVGLMLGIGNVGEFLGSKADADTFISTDAGISWKQARRGAYMWEFGDQGSIIVLVKAKEQTDVVYYSLDEGNTWKEYKFTDEALTIDEITTVPSDNSRNFVLWAQHSDGLATINLDFSGLLDQECSIDETKGDQENYYLWTPKHPKQEDDCLFGHVSEYFRKKHDAQCFNGKRLIPRLHSIARNCSCTRQDYECDFNYFRESEGTCTLVQDAEPPSHASDCQADPNLVEWFDTSGYRRIPLTTCEGGTQMDVTGDSHACPNHEEEYNRKHGIGAVGLFFAIVIPIAVATAAGWWVWRNWEGKFGQIRLGESVTFDDQAPYIKYPVLAISAIVAVVITLPALAMSAWQAVNRVLGRTRTARFTTRSSFARGANYAPVDEDEGELLGEDSDDEV